MLYVRRIFIGASFFAQNQRNTPIPSALSGRVRQVHLAPLSRISNRRIPSDFAQKRICFLLNKRFDGRNYVLWRNARTRRSARRLGSRTRSTLDPRPLVRIDSLSSDFARKSASIIPINNRFDERNYVPWRNVRPGRSVRLIGACTATRLSGVIW